MPVVIKKLKKVEFPDELTNEDIVNDILQIRGRI